MQWRATTRRPATKATIAASLVASYGLATSMPLSAQQAAETPPNAPAALANGIQGSPLADLRRGRDALMNIRDYDAALNPAKAVVEAQREQRDALYAADLAALGLIEGEIRKTEDGVAHLLEAIEVVETAEGTYSPILIDYYRGLGRAYIKGAQYPEAIAALEQAQHISQRNLGLFNVEQSPLLDDITTAYLGLGDTLEAQKIQLERLDNALRRFGASDPRVIPFRYVLASYYERSRLPESAREQYEEVLKSQEQRLGEADAGLLGPLRELASIDLLVSQGADATHRDRLAALLNQNTDADVVERGLSLELLGDWATVTGDTAAARDYYQRAWATFASAPDLDVAAHFAKPVMLDFVAPLSAVDRAERRRPYVWGQVVLEYDVSAEGLPSGVRIVTRDPATVSMQTRYSRRVRETHFRPRLVDGVPVATSNVRSTHYVRYYVADDN
jgi:tetratricopeptide (TPR) repeat protein